MTPLGKGLIRYRAMGGEPVRGSEHYPSGVVIPTLAYLAGDTIDLYLDQGYTGLDYALREHAFEAVSTPVAYAQQQLVGAQTTHRIVLDFIGGGTELDAIEAMQDAAMQGAILFWYPDYDNYPTEYRVCTMPARSAPSRAGVFFRATIELLEGASTTEIPPFRINRHSLVLATSGYATFPYSNVSATSTTKVGCGGFVKLDAAPTTSIFLFGLPGTGYLLIEPSGIIRSMLWSGVDYRSSVGTFDWTGWNHIAWEFDGSLTGFDRLRLLVNGVSVATVDTGTIPATLAAATQFNISWPAPNHIQGKIDNVVILSNSTAIVSDYYTTRPFPDPSSINGVDAWWEFEQSNASSVGSAFVFGLIPFVYSTDIPL